MRAAKNRHFSSKPNIHKGFNIKKEDINMRKHHTKLRRAYYEQFCDCLHNKCYIETEHDGGTVLFIKRSPVKWIDIQYILIRSDVDNEIRKVHPKDVTFWEPYNYYVGIDEYINYTAKDFQWLLDEINSMPEWPEKEKRKICI